MEIAQELESLNLSIEKIQAETNNIKKVLERVLSAHNKSFEVVYNGEMFDFFIPSTSLEFDEIKIKRNRLIELVLKESFYGMVNRMHNDNSIIDSFDLIRVFASGVDPLDLQVEKIELRDLYNVTNSNGEKITAIGLNKEMYHVAQELQDTLDEDIASKWINDNKD